MPSASVDTALCAGHAICTILAPGAFRLDEERGVAIVDAEAGASASPSALSEVAAACPAGAISVEDR
jgi:ferredoxin